MVLEQYPGELLVAIGAIAGSLLTGATSLVRDWWSVRRQRNRLRRALLCEIESVNVDVLTGTLSHNTQMMRTYLESSRSIYESNIDIIGMLSEWEVRYIVAYYSYLAAVDVHINSTDKEKISPTEDFKQELSDAQMSARESIKSNL